MEGRVSFCVWLSDTFFFLCGFMRIEILLLAHVHSRRLSISLQWLLGDKSQTRSSEPVRSVSSTWCVCILGVFVSVNGWWGLSKAAPHSSLLKHFHFQRQRQRALPILCSLKQTERGRDLPWHLVSGFNYSTMFSLALVLTHSPGQWLDFNMVMIRDGGSEKGGEGAHIYCRGIGGGAM